MSEPNLRQSPSSLTERLIRQIRSKPIEDATLERAALFALDTIANAIAGRNTEPGRKLQAWARLATGGADRQAFLAGGLTHILEVDDLHRASVVHPGCVVVPAAYSIARREGRSGREFLVAMLHGYEAACRVGAAVGPAHYRVWHNTASCGPYGSAMASAQLLGLDVAATVDALGNAGTQSFGLWEFLESPTMTKHLHAGRAAEIGVVAADLARLGFTGPPRILEGRRGLFSALCPDASPEKVLEEPTARWQLEQTSIKPWMCCRHTHPAIEAALAIREDLGEEGIKAVSLAVYQAALDVCDKPEPRTEYEAKFSLQHAVAVALLDGRIGFDSFGQDARERTAGLRSRIAVAVSQPIEDAYPRGWGANLEVTSTRGSTLQRHTSAAKGDPEAPLRREEVVAKARILLEYGGRESADALIESVLRMASGGAIPELAFAEPV